MLPNNITCSMMLENLRTRNEFKCAHIKLDVQQCKKKECVFVGNSIPILNLLTRLKFKCEMFCRSPVCFPTIPDLPCNLLLSFLTPSPSKRVSFSFRLTDLIRVISSGQNLQGSRGPSSRNLSRNTH